MLRSIAEILPKDFVEKKIADSRRVEKDAVEQEDIIEAEFLMKYGFEAYWALHPEKDRSKGIGSREMARLLHAGRKIDAQSLLRASQASFVGSASSRSKNPSHAFKVSTQRMVKLAEADV